jgi:lipopolysaccharide export system protein LptC
MNAAAMLRTLVAQFTLYLPMLLMALMALGSWWLAQYTPQEVAVASEKIVRQEPDYFLSDFTVKTFDTAGQLISEIAGQKARHFPHTDILEIDQARLRSLGAGRITTAAGQRAYSNGDGSEVQLVGNALVVREQSVDAQGKPLPRVEFRGDFLHAFMRTEEIKSHKPVTVTRGSDQFSGERMLYNKIDGILQLDGRVRVRLESKPS